MNRFYFLFFSAILLFSCNNRQNESVQISNKVADSVQKTFPAPMFTSAEANKLIELPLHCVGTDYPYKPGETLESKEDLVEPVTVHPIFYG
ncbi:MAG: DUF2891 family protein, partial [Aequorivita sp.]|nr:DUF2891 family protein [Aequorivita sp.]